MEAKVQKQWNKFNKALSEIKITGLPPFNKFRYEIAVLEKKTVVLLSIKTLDSKTRNPNSITNCFIYNDKMPKSKTIVKGVFEVLCDMANHELSEHFYFKNENCFNQHIVDKRYKSKRQAVWRESYTSWYEIALQQRAQMEKCNA